MDPPPAAAPPTATAAVIAPPLTTTTTTNTATNITYPDSVDSSPRSRNTDSWGDDAAAPPPQPLTSASSKLRLMCSYGGHIVPRPHDKSLCYVGGDTRIVVVDRHTTLSSLSSKLSHTLLNGRSFTLKYQLPNEDLDSLISVTTDEDLDNMIEEYDRTNSNPSHNNNSNSHKPSRLRLFLFPLKPDSTQSMIGPILESTVKSEDWFLSALNNGSGGVLNRGFSDSASVNCLLGLDDDGSNHGNGGIKNNSNNSNINVELGARDVDLGLQKNMKLGTQDIQSVPDSPMLETTSSFGSTSSSPSLANLPPIRVHVEESNRLLLQQDQKVGGGGGGGIEEQFAAQLNIIGGGGQKQQQPEDGNFMIISSSTPPPMPATIAVSGVPASGVVVSGGYVDRVFSDDERSDHGVPVGYRKPPASAPPQSQPQQKSSGGSGGAGGAGNIDLPSPDSVSSDNSVSNPLSRQKPMIYQDPSIVQATSGINRVPASNPVDQKVNVSDPNTRVHIQQPIQDSGYMLPTQSQPQFDHQQQSQQQPPQQQYIHAGAHYIHHHPTGAVPVSAYYPVYPSQQQQQHHQHHQLDQQYPAVYYVQARQPQQPYNLPVQQQSGISETATTMPSSRPQTPPNPTVLPSAAAYNQMRNAPIAKPEMAPPGVYRTAAGGAPQLVQLPTSQLDQQYQQQYVGFSQIHHQSQSVAPTSAATANYAYEFADPTHAQIYYTQPLAPTMPSQYQTMTAATGVVLPDASTDNMKQHIRTSQPL